MGIHFGQVSKNLLILTLFVVANTVTFIDNQQRKFTLKGIEIACDRLYAAKHHFAVALFTLQPGGKNIGFQSQRLIFCMVLRHQLFDVRQHQHATTRQPCQFRYHQAFTCTSRQHDNGRSFMTTKMVERGIHGFLLIWTECKNHGLA